MKWLKEMWAMLTESPKVFKFESLDACFFESPYHKMQTRKAEIYIKLCGLRYELLEWDKIMEKKLNMEYTSLNPAQIAKQIGELEAERNLIDLELYEWKDIEKAAL